MPSEHPTRNIIARIEHAFRRSGGSGRCGPVGGAELVSSARAAHTATVAAVWAAIRRSARVPADLGGWPCVGRILSG